MLFVLVGVIGELYIGGVGIVWGYLNCLELIIEWFICYLFNEEECLYCMGDLVCYLFDGNLDYLRRIDN